jgi:hypothetical protein
VLECLSSTETILSWAASLDSRPVAGTLYLWRMLHVLGPPRHRCSRRDIPQLAAQHEVVPELAKVVLRGEHDPARVQAVEARGVPRLEEGMRKAAPEYWPDRRFMAFVSETEETGEEVDADPTPELSRRHAARRGML